FARRLGAYEDRTRGLFAREGALRTRLRTQQQAGLGSYSPRWNSPVAGSCAVIIRMLSQFEFHSRDSGDSSVATGFNRWKCGKENVKVAQRRQMCRAFGTCLGAALVPPVETGGYGTVAANAAEEEHSK